MHDVTARPDRLARLAAPGPGGDHRDQRVGGLSEPQRDRFVAGRDRRDEDLGEEGAALDRRRRAVRRDTLRSRRLNGRLPDRRTSVARRARAA
jgi:hypothetical protein